MLRNKMCPSSDYLKANYEFPTTYLILLLSWGVYNHIVAIDTREDIQQTTI